MLRGLGWGRGNRWADTGGTQICSRCMEADCEHCLHEQPKATNSAHVYVSASSRQVLPSQGLEHVGARGGVDGGLMGGGDGGPHSIHQGEGP